MLIHSRKFSCLRKKRRKWNQYGHCKFGVICRKFHTPNTCFNSNGAKVSCPLTHPRSCLYFVRYGHCKFGTDCSYIHPDPVESNHKIEEDILEIKQTLEKVLSTLALKEIEIIRLDGKFLKFEEMSTISFNQKKTCETISLNENNIPILIKFCHSF